MKIRIRGFKGSRIQVKKVQKSRSAEVKSAEKKGFKDSKE